MKYFRGFSHICRSRLSLRELRSATSGFEAVLLSLLHTRVSGEETSGLQSRSVLCICLEQCTGDAVADSASLSGHTAALDVDQNIKLICILRQHERLANDGLQSLKSEVIIDVSLIDRDLAGSRYKVNTGN